MSPHRSIVFGKEAPVTAPINVAPSTRIEVCFRTSETYLKRMYDAAWINARIIDPRVALSGEETADRPALAGKWRVSGFYWGLGFADNTPTMILDLEPA